jgi:hypothetical protein
MYLVITDFDERLYGEKEKGKLRHYNRSPEADQFL